MAQRIDVKDLNIYYGDFLAVQDVGMTIDLAWGAALVLIVIVLALNLVARLIGKFYAPKTGN